MCMCYVERVEACLEIQGLCLLWEDEVWGMSLSSLGAAAGGTGDGELQAIRVLLLREDSWASD
jgi:hypothetical protein